MSKPTAKQILYQWLKMRQNTMQYIIRNSDMQLVKQYGKNQFGELHNVSTYERLFREAREKWPHRFKDVTKEHPDRKEKSWQIKKKPK